MNKISKGIQSLTEINRDTSSAINRPSNVLNTAADTIENVVELAGNGVVLSLSQAWIAIGAVKPATTEDKKDDVTFFTQRKVSYPTGLESKSAVINRYDKSKMWAVQFGEYFMPLSQTYSVRAKKSLNVSPLVDGIDIIQQVRKEAKTIDCTLKISINENQDSLQMFKDDKGEKKIATLQSFLSELYEKDVVFSVDNETLNDTLGIDYVIMSDYKFMPRAGSKVYIFEFSLMEVKFGDNVLTFDDRQIQEPVVQNDATLA